MSPRRAFTLMELLLVLAILVIASAAVAPSLRGLSRSTTLRSAADRVRAELVRTHVVAMKTGRTQVFRYEEGGTHFTIEPWIGNDDALESPTGATGPGSAAPAPKATTSAPNQHRTLPEGTRFAAGEAAFDTRAQQIEEEVMNMGDSGATLSRPIFFYPDGSSSDAYIIVANDHQQGMRLDLRGMTSAVKLSDISDLKTLEDESRQ